MKQETILDKDDNSVKESKSKSKKKKLKKETKLSKQELLIAELEQEKNEYKDKFIRLYSEFENFRKRTSKEKIDLITNASEDIITSLLSVIDDFERAIKNNTDSKDLEAMKEGTSLIYNKMLSILKQKGLSSMDSNNKEFDTNYHEAIAKVPTENKDAKNKIIDVVEKGYCINEKVIRYAKVVIGE